MSLTLPHRSMHNHNPYCIALALALAIIIYSEEPQLQIPLVYYNYVMLTQFEGCGVILGHQLGHV